MWSPVGERRFDLIVANLPHFPMVAQCHPRAPADLERRRRRRAAPARSVPRGTAPRIWRRAAASFITHNGFVGLERSRQIVEGLGFALRIALTTLINISDDKLARMTQGRAGRAGRPIDPPLRPLRLRRNAHRRDRSTRDDRRMRRLFRALVVVAALLDHGAAARPAGRNPPTPRWRGCCRGRAPRCRAPARSPMPTDLIRILCAGRIRVGIRDYYPLFATRTGETREGYEVDVALAIGRKLGVEVEFVRVNAATRIPLLAEDRIDLAIATMGHNTQRDGQVRFIRPHYYRSETDHRRTARARRFGMEGHSRPHRLRHGGQRLERRAGRPGRPAHAVRRGGRPARAAEGRDLHPGRTGRQLLRLVTSPIRPSPGVTTRSSALPRCRGAWRSRATAARKLARALDLMSQIFHRDGMFLEIARKQPHRHGLPRAPAGRLAAARTATPRRAAPTTPASCRRSTPS